MEEKINKLAKNFARFVEMAKSVHDTIVPTGGEVLGKIAVNFEELTASMRLEALMPPYTSEEDSVPGDSPCIGSAPQTVRGCAGERCNLSELLGCTDWVSTAHAIRAVARGEIVGIIKPGDYFRIPVKANAGSFGGLDFEALGIPETELTVVHTTTDGKIIFNFEEVLFCSAVNAKNISEDGFKKSALCKYLNIQFLDALDPIRDVLTKNRDGNLVTLLTLFEVFGDNEDDDERGYCNWEEEPRQLEYFKKIKNRIRVKDNNTHWWWLSTAASATLFADVSSGGYANDNDASGANGGVAPAICIS
jgi:hypothetical protein